MNSRGFLKPCVATTVKRPEGKIRRSFRFTLSGKIWLNIDKIIGLLKHRRARFYFSVVSTRPGYTAVHAEKPL